MVIFYHTVFKSLQSLTTMLSQQRKIQYVEANRHPSISTSTSLVHSRAHIASCLRITLANLW